MHFCTLFNSAYLSRGLALYESLCKTADDFHLYVFAFDDLAYQILTHLAYPKMTVIALSELEEQSPDLLTVKPARKLGEYCWTCTPATILTCLERFELPQVCYLDADIYFWDNPKVLLDEMTDASVLLTEHRFSPQYDKTTQAGKYCVQFMPFKNDAAGLTALRWWKAACIEWCYDRVEPGRFGDQKYLDDWTTRFDRVVVSQHLGAGVAPWNVQQYDLVNHHGGSPVFQAKRTREMFNLVFYHFHALRFVNDETLLGNYQLSRGVIKALYQPYLKTLQTVIDACTQNEKVADLLKLSNCHGTIHREVKWRDRLKILKQKCLGTYNALKC